MWCVSVLNAVRCHPKLSKVFFVRRGGSSFFQVYPQIFQQNSTSLCAGSEASRGVYRLLFSGGEIGERKKERNRETRRKSCTIHTLGCFLEKGKETMLLAFNINNYTTSVNVWIVSSIRTRVKYFVRSMHVSFAHSAYHICC